MSPSLLAALAGLYLLACLDGSFAGFRAAAGRCARIHKAAFHRRALARGLAASQGAALGVGAVALVVGPAQDALLEGVLAALWIYGAYAGAALAALVVYLAPQPDLSSLATVLVLGPLTLLRVPTILAGAGAAALAGGGRVGLVAAAAAGAMVAVEPLLGRRFAGRDPLSLGGPPGGGAQRVRSR